MRWRWIAPVAFCAAGCAKPDHIEMDPQELTFTRKGQTHWARAMFKDQKGVEYTRQQEAWSTSDPKVAAVDDVDKPGNVTAVGPGHATIAVRGDGLSAELPVSVVTVEKLKVSPETVTLRVDGEHVPVHVEALDGSGRPLKDRAAHMRCENEKICNSDGENVWPAGDPGETALIVGVEDQSVRIPVKVLPAKPLPAKGKKK